jgi:methyl-accepting chemotaxis protein
MKIKFKLSILMIAIMVAIVAGISFILLRQASEVSLDQSKQGITYLATEQAQYWKGREDGYLRVLNTLAHVFEDYEELDPETRRDRYDAILHSTLTSEPQLFAIYTIWAPNAIDGMDSRFTGRTGSSPTGQYAMLWERGGENGEITGRASGDTENAMKLINSEYAQNDRVDDPFARNVQGKDTFLIRMTVPIINPRTNKVVGRVGCLLNFDAIQGAVQNTIASHGGEITIMAIYTNTGFILGHFIPERVGKMMADVDVEYGAQKKDALFALQNGKSFESSVLDPTLGVTINLVTQPFQLGNSGRTWTVMIGASEEYTLAPIHKMTRFTIMLAGIAIVAAAVIIFIVLSGTTKPVAKIAANLKDIAEGEGDLTRSIEIHSKDEIGDLAKYFNETLTKIRGLVITIKQKASSLSDIGGDLASNMTETAAAINQITANIKSIKTRGIHQSASVTETNATMEQITQNIDKLNTHVEQQSASVSESSSAIEEMLANIHSVTQTLIKNAENVSELTTASEVGRAGLEDVAADIREIARESEGLLEINAVMQNIASQTNLLSMNAAIEAAHAGEAGKGFAVVADEIRKLAESSSEQSKTISGVLKKIASSVTKITQSTENVLLKFEAIDGGVKVVAEQTENIRNAMEEQGQGSKQILEAIGKVNEVTQHVMTGSMEMLEGSTEVIHESRNLEIATQEISGGMNEMAAGADQINVAVNQVNEISGKNKENIDLLIREVSRFKV